MLNTVDKLSDLKGFLNKLKNQIRKSLNDPLQFESQWELVASDFFVWLGNLPASISLLALNLELLRLIIEKFNAGQLRDDPIIVDMILKTAKNCGDIVLIDSDKWTITKRSVSPRWGVLYTLKNDKGDVMQHEFFD